MGLKRWLRRWRGTPEARFLEDVEEAQAAALAERKAYFEVGRGKQEARWAELGISVPKGWSVWVTAYGRPRKGAGYVVTQEETRQYGYRWRRHWSVGDTPDVSARWERV